MVQSSLKIKVINFRLKNNTWLIHPRWLLRNTTKVVLPPPQPCDLSAIHNNNENKKQLF